MRQILQNTAIAIAVLVLCLFIADKSLPLFIPVSKTTLESDPLLGLKGRPEVNTIWTREVKHPLPLHLNRYGFHDFERSMHKDHGTFRIITLGDSFVEAYQVPLQENFSQLLEQKFNMEPANSGLPRVEVDNQGVHGYGLGVYYLYVENRIDAWSPDLVLLCFFLGNDFVDNYYPIAANVVPRFGLVDGNLKYHAPEQSLSTWLRDHILAHSNIASILSIAVRNQSALLTMARNNGFISGALPGPLTDQQRSEVLAIARLQLHGIKQHLTDRHIGLFILVIPDPIRVQEVVAGRANNQAQGSPRDRVFLEQGLLNILETEGIPHEYPLDPLVHQVRSGHQMYLEDIGHLTAEGHSQIAQILEKPLQQMIRSQLSESGNRASAAALSN